MNTKTIQAILDATGCNNLEELKQKLIENYPYTRNRIKAVRGVGSWFFSRLLVFLHLRETVVSY
jgi:hypothetical protein